MNKLQNKIYTKTGDKGSTSLLSGERVSKNHERLEAYGTVDELSSFMGMLYNLNISKPHKELILFIQNKLFTACTILADNSDSEKYNNLISEKDINKIEIEIDNINEELPPIKNFLIPAGGEIISYCNIVRTICRRAERRVVEIKDFNTTNNKVLVFLNRLSDLFFVMGRKYAVDNNVKEIFVKSDDI